MAAALAYKPRLLDGSCPGLSSLSGVHARPAPVSYLVGPVMEQRCSVHASAMCSATVAITPL